MNTQNALDPVQMIVQKSRSEKIRFNVGKAVPCFGLSVVGAK